MRLSVGAATDVGRVREINEDSALAQGAIFLVADGMGGHAAGEVASGIVVDTMRELADREELLSDEIVDHLARANDAIHEEVAADPAKAGMGTTAAGLAVVTVGGTDHWAVFNVGDSRVYRYLDGGLTCLTVDHSEVRELMDAGVITAQEARTHPMRNVVTRSLGTAGRPQVDVWVFPPFATERFVICSDGLSNELEDDEIAEVLAEHPGAQAAAEALVRAAVEAGGRDNVTVVVVDLEGVNDDPDADTVPRSAVGSGEDEHEGSGTDWSTPTEEVRR